MSARGLHSVRCAESTVSEPSANVRLKRLLTPDAGDIVMFWVMGRPTILLGRMEHAEALLQKRMMNYGDRPELVMAQEFITQNGWYSGTARSHHNTHKKQRKILNERLRAKALREWAHPAVMPELHL